MVAAPNKREEMGGGGRGRGGEGRGGQCGQGQRDASAGEGSVRGVEAYCAVQLCGGHCRRTFRRFRREKRKNSIDFRLALPLAPLIAAVAVVVRVGRERYGRGLQNRRRLLEAETETR
jgi:hypothetical protein